MPLIQTSLMADLVKNIETTTERWRRSVLYRMTAAGERAVNAAREGHTYKDRTGNLTSSIGYLIVEDGQVVQQSSLSPVMNGEEGNMEWQEYARRLVSRFPTGMALIVVAGMKYAAYVSARKYNVLDSAEAIAEELVKKIH
ncbi:MAG: hypothetical protein LUC24_05370 [Bacteroidales bacterium]|nr:hypothetical protein [Bacteroidales bacterium]